MVRNHHPYTPALGCEAQLDAWCEKNCPHSDDHSPLRARLDASSVDATAAWRCYAPSTLSDDGQRYAPSGTPERAGGGRSGTRSASVRPPK